MAEPSLVDCEECLPPEEAFGVLASDTRLAILEALWDAEASTMSFSALRREVGMTDSAQFNYHLDKLRDQFVRKTDDGYELAHAGRAVVQAVVSGTLTEQPELGPFPVEGTCSECGGDLQAHYTDERLRITCEDCGFCLARYPFPPGGLAERSREQLLGAFDQRVRHFHCLMADGVCPHCGGTVETTVSDGDNPFGLSVVVRYRCELCDHQVTTPVGMAVLDHVEVVSFYRDHGIDLNDRPAWTLSWLRDDDCVAVESTDPWRIELTVPCENERLVMTLGEDLAVLDSERLSVAATRDDAAAADD